MTVECILLHRLGFNDPTLWPQSAAASQFGSAAFQDLQMTSSTSVMSGGADDGDASESLSFNQRNVKKWEVDEPLGEMATISPVLYCNLRHPELKIHYPGNFLYSLPTKLKLCC
jgi:hypothetical protein